MKKPHFVSMYIFRMTSYCYEQHILPYWISRSKLALRQNQIYEMLPLKIDLC